MNANKPRNIDEYIARFPSDIQERLQKLRTAIRNAAPRDTEEAIKYQMPTFVWKGNLIHFAAYKNHIGLYPGSKPIANFKDVLAKYKTSKGAIQLPLDKPIPIGLITKIVKFNVKRFSDRL
jgi:uncharacterized protein YdhG (YjbR/CyaY superfamily)